MTEKEYTLSIEEMEHYRLKGLEKANKYKFTYELSNAIAAEFEHYSDRWNPARMEFVNAMIGVLVERLRTNMNYVEDLWINPAKDTYAKRHENQWRINNDNNNKHK